MNPLRLGSEAGRDTRPIAARRNRAKAGAMLASMGHSQRSLDGALADGVILTVLKLALGAYVLYAGFSHVSDDDYARTVIAQQFAQSPRLDPSGTSWLPLPFWLFGTCMAFAGRTLATARVVAITLGTASVIAPYFAMRVVGVARLAAVIATGIAMSLPWNAWLGVATVPEAWTGALLAATAIAVTDDKARPWSIATLFAASLSRYETWPACGVCALLCTVRALSARRDRGRAWVDGACAAVAVAGVALWMAWNIHAHGSATHFLTRVSTFRRATGAADLPLETKVFAYPRALLTATPEVAALGLVGILGLVTSPVVRARWRWSAAVALAVLAFLVEGDIRDGAPTHHPERALAGLWWILTGLGVDTIAVLAAPFRARRPLALGLTAAVLAWAATLPARFHDYPGNTDAERRDTQIARGEGMRARHVAWAEITPCAYEHFALLAAWGEPERARIGPPTHAPLTPECPEVVETGPPQGDAAQMP